MVEPANKGENASAYLKHQYSLHMIYAHYLLQGFPTCGPRAACSPQGNTVWPAESYK